MASTRPSCGRCYRWKSLVVVCCWLLASSCFTVSSLAFGFATESCRRRVRGSSLNAKHQDTRSRSGDDVGNNNNKNRQQRQQHPYGSYLATCIPGLSEVLADELQLLGGQNVQVSGLSAVAFDAYDKRTILHVLIWTRVALKVSELLVSTSSSTLLYNRNDLYSFIRNRVPVLDLLQNNNNSWLTLSVQTVLNNKDIPDDINHSHYTSLTVKNALVDGCRAINQDRPNVDTVDGDVPLLAVLRGSSGNGGAHLSLYRTIHTGSLHRRGYRRDTTIHKAALKETTAAGLLYLCQYHQSNKAPLVDPMCGSGTILTEAALIAADMAPHLVRIKNNVPGSRIPPIVRWKDDDEDDIEELWQDELQKAAERAEVGATDSPIIWGNDIHPAAIALAQQTARLAGVEHLVHFSQKSCGSWRPSISTTSTPWQVVTNPPWGLRLDDDDMHSSWEELRLFLRQTCPPNTDAWILSGSKQATKHLGLKRSRSIPLRTAQQELRFLHYTIRDPTLVQRPSSRNEWLT